MASEDASFVDELRREADRLEEDILYSEKAHFAIATVWSRINYILGIPAAMLAAVAGISHGNIPGAYVLRISIRDSVRTSNRLTYVSRA
jgi:hypothetical protein